MATVVQLALKSCCNTLELVNSDPDRNKHHPFIEAAYWNGKLKIDILTHTINDTGIYSCANFCPFCGTKLEVAE